MIQIICGTDIFEDKTALSCSVPGLWEEVGGAESLGMRLKVELLHGNRDGINQ